MPHFNFWFLNAYTHYYSKFKYCKGFLMVLFRHSGKKSYSYGEYHLSHGTVIPANINCIFQVDDKS